MANAIDASAMAFARKPCGKRIASKDHGAVRPAKPIIASASSF